MLLERLGLHQRQGKCGQPVRSKSRMRFEGVSVIVPQIAKHRCVCRHRWNPDPNQGPFVKRMAMHLGQFTVISLAENVTALYRVLPVSQSGHSNPESQKHHHSWWGQCGPCQWQHRHAWWCLPLHVTWKQQSRPSVCFFLDNAALVVTTVAVMQLC